jgi:hypothetical protein
VVPPSDVPPTEVPPTHVPPTAEVPVVATVISVVNTVLPLP